MLMSQKLQVLSRI